MTEYADITPGARVVCAAMLMDDGLIVPGVRHFSPDMRAVLHRIYGDDYHRHVEQQGFILSSGQFVSRSTALIIARAHDQIIRRPQDIADKLYSENLY